MQDKAKRFIREYKGRDPTSVRDQGRLQGALLILHKLEVLSPYLQDAIKIALDAARKPQ